MSPDSPSQWLLVAPGAAPPWTEGRKILVRDLRLVLSENGSETHLITGSAPGRAPTYELLATLLDLIRRALQANLSHTRFLIFPYGRFSGVRGLANVLFIGASAWILRLLRRRYLIVCYSVDHFDIRWLRALCLQRCVLSGQPMRGQDSFHVGLGDPPRSLTWQGQGQRVVSFMCGYQTFTPATLAGVMHERGLHDLLCALALLDPTAAVHLRICIPFLSDITAFHRLTREIDTIAPGIAYSLHGEVDRDLELQSCDILAFPYASSHTAFVPHTLIEAGFAGVPVLASDQPMYRILWAGFPARYALAPPRDPPQLANALMKLLDTHSTSGCGDPEQRRRWEERWTISTTAAQIRHRMDVDWPNQPAP